MATRREQILQELGIVQWEVRSPAVLKGEVGLLLPAGCQLLLVAQQPPSLKEPLLQDILRALRVTPQQVCMLRAEQLPLLPKQESRAIWYLGIEPTAGLSAHFLTSPELAQLRQDSAAKRALWQQISQYDRDLIPSLP
ncbi:MAG: DNA polymerase III subunit psi [Enterobacteriaceae bacterium]